MQNMNIMDIMKKANDLQEQIDNLEAKGLSGGGLVEMTLNGDGMIKILKIDPSLMVPGESEILEDLIVAAYSDAKTKIKKSINQKTKEITTGLPIPPGFKLPF